MKKYLMLFIVLLLVGCGKKTNIIKKDYEKDNDILLSVKITDNNIEKIKINEIKDKLSKNGIVYFCLPSSNYCRNNIEVLIELVNDMEVKTYYVDLTDIRSTKEYNDFVNEYKDYLKEKDGNKYIYEGDILMFYNNKIIEYMTLGSEQLVTSKLTEEEKKTEYKRLYDGVSKLIESYACDIEDSGC